MNQDLYDKAKNLLKQDACIQLYDTPKPLYLETDASSISLGAGLLQVRDGMSCWQDKVLKNTALCPVSFARKSISSAEWWYSNIECKVLGVMDGLEKFHHYCFAKEVYIITDHKLLVAMS